MQVSNHGGLCCGVAHLHGFGDPDEQHPFYDHKERYVKPEHDRTDAQEFDRIMEMYEGRGTLLEVVLTDYQLSRNEEFWRGKLDVAGFKLVSRCKNSNSPNFINVFHYHPDRKG